MRPSSISFASVSLATSRRRPSNSFRHFIPLTRIQELRWRAELYGTAAVPGADFNDAALGPMKGLRDIYRDGIMQIDQLAQTTKGAPFAYVNPATGKTFDAAGGPVHDPIWTWYHYFAPQAAPIDAIRLYVGNVPGPVFATSLLAVAIGIAWLAYARRLSLVVLATFVVGAMVPVYLYHWDLMFQLDSGPTWFVAGILLADRRLLPGSWAIRPVLGLVAGVLALGLRARGYGIEAVFFTVAGIQATAAVITVIAWGGSLARERWRRNRRLRLRDAQLRVVKGIPKAS